MIVKLGIIASLFVGLTAASLCLPPKAGGGMGAKRRLPHEYWANLLYWLSVPLVTWLIGRTTALVLGVLAVILFAPGEQSWRGFGPIAELPIWASAGAAFVCADFANYWVHRASHHSKVLWPLHAIHHSSIHLDWHSALRIHPLDRLMMRFGVLLFLLCLGFPLGALAGTAAVAGLIGILVHIDSDRDFGPLRCVIATPRFHRWHHASCPAARGKNLAGIFPLWDLLFGTFYMPREEVAHRFGPAAPLPMSLRAHLISPVRASLAAVLTRVDIGRRSAPQ